jgi:hypothetical protein
MQIIHTFDLPSPGEFSVQLPSGAEVLGITIQNQVGLNLMTGGKQLQAVPKAIVRVDPGTEERTYRFALVPNSVSLPDGAQYVGSFSVDQGLFHLLRVDSVPAGEET